MSLHQRDKIYVIGYGKCGTTSLHQFFTRSGLRSVHWDDGRLSRRMVNNIERGVCPIEGYDEYDVFLNFGPAHKHFRYIMKWDPDAKFILNVRDVDKWVNSRISWLKRNHPRSIRIENVENTITHMKTQWYAHLAAVKHDIPSDRLLVFDIEKDNPLAICKFVGLPDNCARLYRQYNRTRRELTPMERKFRLIWLVIKIFIPRCLRYTIKSAFIKR